MTVEFESERAFRHVQDILALGPRLRGSRADAQTAELIGEYMGSLGLAVSEQSFPVETGSVVEYRVEILDPPIGEIECYPMLLTPDTPRDGLVGDLVTIEDSRPPNVGAHIAGKIVLAYASPLVDMKEILRHAPAALILIDSIVGIRPKRYAVPSERWKPFDAVPGFRTTYDDGVRIIRAGASKVRLTLRSECSQGMTRNVVGELRGTEQPDEIVLVGGHYDGNPDIPAATDNASGIAVVMELARLYAARGARRTMRFIGWGAEEGGCLGSRHYARDLRRRDTEQRAAPGFVKGRDSTELDKHMLNVAVDVVGATVGFDVCYCLGGGDLSAAVTTLAAELGDAYEMRARSFSSDHEPLVLAGVPGVCFAREGGAFSRNHGVEDCIDVMDALHLGRAGRFIDAFLARAVNAASWPFKREVPPDILKTISEAFAYVVDEELGGR